MAYFKENRYFANNNLYTIGKVKSIKIKPKNDNHQYFEKVDFMCLILRLSLFLKSFLSSLDMFDNKNNSFPIGADIRPDIKSTIARANE